MFDPGYVLYLYESPAGYAIVVLRLLSWGWFVYAVVFTLYRYPEKLSFYTQLVVIYTTWFVSMPALVLIATFAIPNWIREKSVSFVEELIMAFAHIAFLVSFHLYRHESFIQEHLKVVVRINNY